MSNLEAMTNMAFMTDEDGETVYFPSGFLGPGYVVDSPDKFDEIYVFLGDEYMKGIVLTVIYLITLVLLIVFTEHLRLNLGETIVLCVLYSVGFFYPYLRSHRRKVAKLIEGLPKSNLKMRYIDSVRLGMELQSMLKLFLATAFSLTASLIAFNQIAKGDPRKGLLFVAVVFGIFFAGGCIGIPIKWYLERGRKGTQDSR